MHRVNSRLPGDNGKYEKDDSRAGLGTTDQTHILGQKTREFCKKFTEQEGVLLRVAKTASRLVPKAARQAQGAEQNNPNSNVLSPRQHSAEHRKARVAY